MKLKIRYENEFQTIELDAKATEEMWVTLSIEIDGAVTQDEKEQLIQEEWDKQFNRPEYNVYHRETRHIDPTPKKKRMDGKNRYIVIAIVKNWGAITEWFSSVSKVPQTGGVVTCRNVNVRERFLRLLFGRKQKVTILIPGDSISEVSICESEGGVNIE